MYTDWTLHHIMVCLRARAADLIAECKVRLCTAVQAVAAAAASRRTQSIVSTSSTNPDSDDNVQTVLSHSSGLRISLLKCQAWLD